MKMKMNEKLRKWCYILRVPILLIVYLIFLTIGAGIIQGIESGQDRMIRNNERSRLKEVLRKYNMSARDPKVKEILRATYNAIRVDALKLNKMEDDDEDLEGRWKFTGSLFFIGTLVTTIGMDYIIHFDMFYLNGNCYKQFYTCI